jgi:hypothetical protein
MFVAISLLSVAFGVRKGCNIDTRCVALPSVRVRFMLVAPDPLLPHAPEHIRRIASVDSRRSSQPCLLWSRGSCAIGDGGQPCNGRPIVAS